MTAPVLAIVDRAKNAVAVWNALVTSVYKLVGFVMLTLILVGLASYFAIHAFYLVSDSWVAPVILSAHHDRVLQLNSQKIQQSYQRDRIRAERLSLLGQLEAGERSIALNEVFQQSFQTAMREELASREVLLADTAALERRHRKTLGAQVALDREFVSEAERELEAQYAAGLIERSAYLESKRGLAAIAHAELAADERVVRLAASVRDSKREIDDMRGVIRTGVDEATGEAGITRSYDVLMMEREYENSLHETNQLKRERGDALRLISIIDESLARYDQLLTSIESSPYRRALIERVTLAFSPYENLDKARPGVALYGCSLGLVWCRRVGTVTSVTDGEVAVKHPLSNEQLRGLMIEIELDEPHWAEEKALYLGSAPFFL